VAKSVEATGQAKLRAQLDDLRELWKGVQFVTKNYKERENQFILGAIDDMYQYLDEGLATINMILGNRFVKIMRSEAEKTKKELSTLQDALEQWVEVQRQWCYLENIFSGGSIKQQLPEESKLFSQVDKAFHQLNQKANKNPVALKIIRSTNNIVDSLKKLNSDLEKIQSRLNLYVEDKRRIFPRFYFLSFEDLIQILSNSDDKNIISLHLKSLFDGIVKLDIKDDSVCKMMSKEGEWVELARQVKTARVDVERWLGNLTDTMKETVSKKLKDGQKAYTDEGRKDWVLQHPGQVVASVAQI
jgi:dynein heavy chain